MELEEFSRDLRSDVVIRASADSNFTHSAFVDVVIDYLAEAGEVIDFEPCYYRGMSGRHAVWLDGYAFDRVDSSVRVFVANPKLSDEATTLTQTEAQDVFKRLKAFVEDAITGRLDNVIDDNSPARGFADQLRSQRKDVARVRAYLLTDSVLSSKVRDWPEETLFGIPIEFHIWDISRLHRVRLSASGQEQIVVEFGSSGEPGVPCIEASMPGTAYRSYLCVIPGTTLADVYDTVGSRLLEGNVRAFLSAKGKVNKGIRNTVVSKPDMFFAFNNGIAATASDVQLLQTDRGLRLVSAMDLQIVNGGQTTASLAAARRAEKVTLESVFVPMKLSVIDPEMADQLIPQISRCANSQNKVSEADFFSNHEFHRRLEQISRRLWAPAVAGAQHETHWFYERARGQYLNETAAMTSAQERRFREANPKHQLISKTDLAKSENSWLEKPQIVSRGAQTNFGVFANEISARWVDDKIAFNEEYFRNAVARMILFRKTEQIVTGAAWYSGGYRANVVTYTIARIAYELRAKKMGEIDFAMIWHKQMISPAVSAQVAATAEKVYESITAPVFGAENVTQWCKKDLCWEAVRATPIEVLPQFVGELVVWAATRCAQREARALQRIDSGIEAQSAVIALGDGYWKALASWALERKLIGVDDTRLLSTAADFGKSIPSERQAAKLLQLKKRVEGDGFVFRS